MPPLWLLALGAALLGALLLSLAMFARRQRAQRAPANLALAGAGAPLLPPMLDGAEALTTLPADALTEASDAPVEAPNTAPAESAPIIVPVLEADVAPVAPSESTPEGGAAE